MTTVANTAAAPPFPAAEVAAAVGRALAAANDRPNPILDASRTPREYAALARDFRDNAWEHLGKNDLPQASNKAWGLVAETIKAISTAPSSTPTAPLWRWLPICAVWLPTPAIWQPRAGSAPLLRQPASSIPTFTRTSSPRRSSWTASSSARSLRIFSAAGSVLRRPACYNLWPGGPKWRRGQARLPGEVFDDAFRGGGCAGAPC